MKILLRLTRSPWLPIGWFLMVLVLMILPGNSFPKMGVFSVSNLDKYVHIILFGVMVVLFNSYQFHRAGSIQGLLERMFTVFLLAVAFGITIEFVQFFFVANRDFDVADIAADLVGSSLSYGLCNIKLPIRLGHKKAPVETGAVTKTNCL